MRKKLREKRMYARRQEEKKDIKTKLTVKKAEGRNKEKDKKGKSLKKE